MDSAPADCRMTAPDFTPAPARRGVAAALRTATLALVCIVLSACGTMPAVERPVTTAWSAPEDSPLAKVFHPQLAGHPGQSGLHALPNGLDALSARAALAEEARHTLDLQYYIVRADTTTRLLVTRVLAAAQRGVRVRLLVDDLDAAGKDLDFSRFAGFPNIEVRLFNPFGIRGNFGLPQVFEFLGNARLNRRMHNKLWIADNAVAVIGGRNLGDEYFEANENVNFSDLDLLVAGPAVAEMSRSFDAYWNSPWAVPIQAFVPDRPDAADLSGFEQRLRMRVTALRETEYGQALRDTHLWRALREGALPLVVAPVETLVDPPEKIGTGGAGAGPSVFVQRVRPLLERAKHELILISPYFIPGDEGLQVLGELTRRGVRVRALTNSLASADTFPLAQAGYSRRRERLLAAGVELNEMRPEGAPPRPGGLGSSSGAYLHTKAIIIDRRWVLVGSMNLDPRSRLSNTEIGVLADSVQFGDEMGKLFDGATQAARAFRVTLVPVQGAAARLQWTTQENGREVVYDKEPRVSALRRALMRLLGALTPEDLL